MEHRKREISLNFLIKRKDTYFMRHSGYFMRIEDFRIKLIFWKEKCWNSWRETAYVKAWVEDGKWIKNIVSYTMALNLVHEYQRSHTRHVLIWRKEATRYTKDYEIATRGLRRWLLGTSNLKDKHFLTFLPRLTLRYSLTVQRFSLGYSFLSSSRILELSLFHFCIKYSD